MSSKRKDISRREFLSRGGQAAAGVVAGSALVPFAVSKGQAGPMGANDRINLAVIGIRGQGSSHIRGFSKLPGVHLKTLCDVDENLFPERVKMVEEAHGYAPGTEWDLRRVLDDNDIDAVTIAAPNHWHALATTWACQAGKHVYVEKPSSHNVWEGRKMVEAARNYNCLVQVGFQNRSRRNTRAAMKFIHDGKLGKIHMARGLCFKPRDDIGRYPDGPVPNGEEFHLRINPNSGKMTPYTAAYLENVHYDLWLGPAAKRPFNRNYFHYNWHWHWDYGNGDTGNQGPHQFDIARWGLNRDDYPIKVRSFGGYFAFDSSQETPNTQTSVFEYADGTILEFGTRGLVTNSEGDVRIGDLFYGTEGWMQIDSGGKWQTFFGRKNEPGPTSEETKEEEYDPMQLTGTGAGGHYGNFINALRSGKTEDLNCDIEVGHLSSALPHIANISYRLGRELMFDGSKERFVGDEEADRMLTRKYREPYVVPETV